MSIIHQLTFLMGFWAVRITDFFGYPGISFLMALESMVVPLPSELVMSFAGFLVHQGRFSFIGALSAATLGSLIGSLISYAMGYYGGELFVKKISRYLLLDEKDLEWSEKWFAKRGEVTIFFARFMPVVRHLISIPAGLAKMNLKKFSLYTVLGAAPWNAFLLWTGIVAGQKWQIIRKYSEPLSLIIFGLLILGALIFCWRHLKRKKTA